MSVLTVIEESPALNLQPFIINIYIEGFEGYLFSKKYRMD
jgi:hypothetical protein